MQKAGGGTSARDWSPRGTRSATHLGTRGSHARGVVYILIRETGERSWAPTYRRRSGRHKSPRSRIQRRTVSDPSKEQNKASSELATKGYTARAGQRDGLRGAPAATLARVSRLFHSCRAAGIQLLKEPLFQPTSIPHGPNWKQPSTLRSRCTLS